jgi:prevent-host-death family protein
MYVSYKTEGVLVMTRLSASAVREEFSETLNRVAYKGERIVLERRGKDVAALVPIEDLELLEELEDRMDLDAARKALKEQGSISLDELKVELGI